MMKASESTGRTLHTLHLTADLAITGGGLSGVCCAITAAREGLQVVLLQDRPVLGGNASSEVRLWVLGATSHMGNNNRWAREGGVIDELLLENAHRNPDGNALFFDTLLLEKVLQEKNITLCLNTAVYDLDKKDADTIACIRAFCSQNSTRYEVTAPIYCDASGDGILGFLSGAAFRMGAEPREEFGEAFAPDAAYGGLLGHSLYFYSKDAGRPVAYHPPSFALTDITKIPRFRNFHPKDFGCRLWWIEYGGRLDTVHEAETIKMELWKVVYGVWNHIKNSGQFPEAANLTLEWVGTIPGKRESRRFEGYHMLTQQDIVEQRPFEDAVAFGGWSVDLHPADGVFSEKPGCNQWHGKGVYPIPYRCYVSRNITNLFLAGRLISASHVAFGSSRVMATCAHGAQAVGMAAALCKQYNVTPKQVGEAYITELQQRLLKTGQHIPGVVLNDAADLTQQATLTASSTLLLDEIPAADIWKPLQYSAAQMLPVQQGPMPVLTFTVRAQQATELTVELRRSSKVVNHTPDTTLYTETYTLQEGEQVLSFDAGVHFEEDCYAFVHFIQNERVLLQYSNKRVTGLLSVFNKANPAVSNYGKQEPAAGLGFDTFEFWCPERRPEGQNIAMTITPGLAAYATTHLQNGLQRPVSSTNAWVAAYEDRSPELTLSWNQPTTIHRMVLSFDADYDNPLENVLILQPETVMPFCVNRVEVRNSNQEVVGVIEGNYLSQRTLVFDKPVVTQQLKLSLYNSMAESPVSLFEVRCY
ncbi:hypothetical protein HNQ91_003389 [Filimonas zeae]|uniref:FAD dependent oxidoreductase n=1 Tax=Filimonas zeae TaxID=1737353 RepID=A0A917IZ89_9BACT|nr:FAD-dependent oxidoreductase [Filimonas zeae]MDR6340324.1 hypothetical protein [Filimonas zeae]GGH72198.1 hypothetical protein GCM10011379_32360 [Filimonas zeae]